MTSFPTTPHLNIIFTLAQSSNLFHWSPQLPLKGEQDGDDGGVGGRDVDDVGDVMMNVLEHVEPMLNDLHPFINFTLSTQVSPYF